MQTVPPLRPRTLSKRRSAGAVGAVLALWLVPLPSRADPPELAGPAFLPGDGEISAAAGTQSAPAIVRGGDLYLAAWHDARGDVGGQQTVGDIFAARIALDGTLVDETPIALTLAPGIQGRPQVAWNGTNWLVVWESQEMNPAMSYFSAHVRAARVSPAGVVLDDPPVLVYAMPWSDGLSLAVASDGDSYAIVTEGTSANENDLRGFRVSAAGQLLTPGGRVLVPASYYLRFFFRMAYAGGSYLLVFDDLDAVQGRRFAPDLTPRDATPFDIAVGPAVGAPALASNGSEFLAIWSGPAGFSSAVYATRVSAQGVRLDEPPLNLSAASGAAGPRDVAWAGTHWLITWNDAAATLLAARVTAAGDVLDPGGAPLPEAQAGAIAGGPDGEAQAVFAADSGLVGATGDVTTFRLSADLSPDPATPLATGAPSQLFGDLAGDGTVWLAVWQSDTSPVRRILGHRLAGDGIPATAEPLEIARGARLNRPYVAFNGDVFLVTWSDGATGQVHGRRFSRTGEALDLAPRLIMSGVGGATAALGDLFLVTAADLVGSYAHNVFPFAVRVRATDGAVIDPAPMALGNLYALPPRVVAFGDRWLVVWARQYSHDDLRNEIVAAFVNPDGALSGSLSLGLALRVSNPAVGAGPERALVVWQDRLGGGVNDFNLFGRLLSPDGTLHAPLQLTDGIDWRGRAAITWQDDAFVVAYEDQRDNLHFFDQRSDVYLTRVGPTGTLIDPAGLPVAVADEPETWPFAATAGGRTFIGASLFMPEAPWAAYRLGLYGVDPPQATTRIAELTGEVAPSGGGQFRYRARLLVMGEDGAPAGGATVGVRWLAPDGRAAGALLATGADGSAETTLVAGAGRARLTVEDVKFAGRDFARSESLLALELQAPRPSPGWAPSRQAGAGGNGGKSAAAPAASPYQSRVKP